jgi:hypothetical protein
MEKKMEEKLLEQLIIVTNELVMQIALRFNYSDFENIRQNHPMIAKAIATIKEAQESVK